MTKYLNRTQAAARLGICTKTLRKLDERGGDHDWHEAAYSMVGAAFATGVAAGMAGARAILAGLTVLTAVRDTGAGLAAMGSAQLALGRSLLMFLLVTFRGIGTASLGIAAPDRADHAPSAKMAQKLGVPIAYLAFRDNPTL